MCIAFCSPRWELVRLLQLILTVRDLDSDDDEDGDTSHAPNTDENDEAESRAEDNVDIDDEEHPLSGMSAQETRAVMRQHRLPILLEVVRKMVAPPAPLTPLLLPAAAQRLLARIKRNDPLVFDAYVATRNACVSFFESCR